METPSRVGRAKAAAADAGFGLSCEPGVGELLSVLSAAVRAGGSILELGTGAGVGVAWIVTGLAARTDVSVTSVELEPEVAAAAAQQDWPPYVQLEVGDALEVLRRQRGWSLIFADAQGGKWEGLDDTIDALEPGGVLLVDDMAPTEFTNDLHRDKTAEVRATLLGDPRILAVEIGWSSGVILCTRVDGR